MAEESDLEKTEPASSRRLEQAREEGQVPRSREIGAFMVLFVSAGAFWSVGPWMMQRLGAIVRRGLTLDSALLGEPPRPVTVSFLEPILHSEQEGRRGIATLARARIERAMAGG